MNAGKTLFAQVIVYVPWKASGRIVERHGGDAGVRAIDLARAVAGHRIVSGGQSSETVSHGLGWRTRPRPYAKEPTVLDLDATIYALNAITIDLCLNLFDWAPFRTTKVAVKMHALLDLRGAIPASIHISDGKMGDVNVLDLLPVEAGAFYVMDRGYLDFGRLFTVQQAGAFFVTRAKRGMNARRVYSAKTDRTSCLKCDQRIALNGFYDAKDYPEHLRIKRFLGTSKNAVKTQIWCAVSTYILIAILKKELHLNASLYTFLQILSVSVFEIMPLSQAFSGSSYNSRETDPCRQLNLSTIEWVSGEGDDFAVSSLSFANSHALRLRYTLRNVRGFAQSNNRRAAAVNSRLSSAIRFSS